MRAGLAGMQARSHSAPTSSPRVPPPSLVEGQRVDGTQRQLVARCARYAPAAGQVHEQHDVRVGQQAQHRLGSPPWRGERELVEPVGCVSTPKRGRLSKSGGPLKGRHPSTIRCTCSAALSGSGWTRRKRRRTCSASSVLSAEPTSRARLAT